VVCKALRFFDFQLPLRGLAAITLGIGSALILSLPTSSLASEGGGGASVVRDAGDEPTQGAVRFEHHGSFRFRPELLLGGDLGPGESPVPRPLSARTGDDPDASSLAWASIRLRYEPILRIGRSMSVHLGIDALDNLVLGSTHANGGRGVAWDLLRDSAAPPSAGLWGWRDSVRVRHLYGQLRLLELFEIRVGRMPDPFGLGITRHAGDCADCDFGTVVDAMRLGFSFTGIHIEGSWEWTAVGATTERPGWPGPAKDLGQADDVQSFTVQIGQRPITLEDHAARAELLDERRGWALDWGVFMSFTDQGASSLEQIPDTSIACRPEQVTATGQPLVGADCIRLFPRLASFWRPGLWIRAMVRPDHLSELRIEFEAQAVMGDIVHPQRLDDADPNEAKDFLGFGGALEVAYRTGLWGTGLDAGFATGDDGEFVGVLDGQNIVEPDDDAYAQNDNVRLNRRVTSFFFNRDYRIDLILFRQVLGAVTNAVYFKPWVSFDLLQMEEGTLFARLDFLYAMAAVPEGTPGGGRHWGVELDGRIGLRLESGLTASLAAGVLIPLDALSNRVTGASPDPAFGLRGLMTWSF